MSDVVKNPWRGYPVGADWDWHVENSYQGGTDYKVPADTDVRSAVAGRAVALGDALNSVAVTMDNGSGTRIVHMENKRLVGKFPRTVRVDEIIAKTGLARRNPAGKMIVRWPHIHAIVRGSRTRFERLLTAPATGGNPTPIPPTKPSTREDDDMAKAGMIHYIKGTDVKRGIYVPGTPYFVEFSESKSGQYANPLSTSLETGPSVLVTESLFGAFRAAAVALRPAELGALVQSETVAQTVTLTGTITPK